MHRCYVPRRLGRSAYTSADVRQFTTAVRASGRLPASVNLCKEVITTMGARLRDDIYSQNDLSVADWGP